jgi:hypothetical protein
VALYFYAPLYQYLYIYFTVKDSALLHLTHVAFDDKMCICIDLRKHHGMNTTTVPRTHSCPGQGQSHLYAAFSLSNGESLRSTNQPNRYKRTQQQKAAASYANILHIFGPKHMCTKTNSPCKPLETSYSLQVFVKKQAEEDLEPTGTR